MGAGLHDLMLIPLKDFNQQVRAVPLLLPISLLEVSSEFFALCHDVVKRGMCDIPSSQSTSLSLVLNDVCANISTAILYFPVLYCTALYCALHSS